MKKDILWNKNFVIACLANFLIACAFNLFMPTIPLYLVEYLGVEKTETGIVLASYGLALFVIRPVCGYLVDVYERKPLFILGVTLFVATFAGYYFAATVIFFVILRFVHGLWWALATVSNSTIAVDIIPASRRAEGIGYFGVVMNVAMAIAPYIAVKIYYNYDFDTLISCAIGMGILAISVALFIKVPKIRKIEKEKKKITLDSFLLIKGIPILFNQLFISFCWGTLVGYAVLYGKEIDIENAGVFFLFLAGGTVLSRVFSGKLVDKGFIHSVILTALIVCATSFLLFAKMHSIFWFCFSAFFIGIGFGTLFPALQTLYINMASFEKRGAANSTYLMGFDIGIGLGMLFGSMIADKYDFSGMYLTASAFCFIAFLIYGLISRKIYNKNKLPQI